MTTEHFDLIILGTGSGNTIPTVAFKDKKIAIVERGTFGGTCINVGCIPTKMFVYTADVAREFADSQRLSLTGELKNVDWQDIQRRIFADRIDPIAEAGEEYRRGPKTPNITFISGNATFTGERSLDVSLSDANSSPSTISLTADDIVVATGSRSFIPDVIKDSGVRYRTNADIMRLEKLPESLTILGGGIIAAEFAHVFSALGTKVTVINRSPELLKNLDSTVVERFNKRAKEQWTNILGASFTDFRENADGSIVVTLDNGQEVVSDELLVALGRVPNSDELNVDAAGVETDDKGSIIVDDYARTTAPGVWALGDASNKFQLKHVANNEARVIQHNLLHPDDMKMLNHEFVPSGIFTFPQIATVGMTEAEARDYEKETGHAITVKVQDYSDVAYGWAMEERDTFCKLIADAETGKLLGAHLMGPQATTLIQQLITVLVFDLDVRLVARNQYWPHPSLSEVVENALLGLEFQSEAPEDLRP